MPYPGTDRTAKKGEKMKRTTLMILTMCVSTIFLLNSSAMGAEQLSYGQINYVTLKAGIYSPQSNELDGFDEGFNGEIAFGHYFHRNVAIEIDIGYLETESKSSGVNPIIGNFAKENKITAIPVTLTGKLVYPSNKLELFAELGIGAYFVDMTSTVTGIYSIDENDTTFGFLLGLGFNYDITETIFFGLEGKYFWANPRFDTLGSPDIDGIVATANLGFRF